MKNLYLFCEKKKANIGGILAKIDISPKYKCKSPIGSYRPIKSSKLYIGHALVKSEQEVI